jgi:hydrogenase nickel incorporation protein HypA/HybF
MHELSICQALIDQVEMIAQQRNAMQIDKILVQIGPLSGIESHLLAQAYPLASAGSIAQYAELVIEDLPIRIRCEECGMETSAQANKLICGACGNWRTQLLSGDEMLLKSVEMI